MITLGQIRDEIQADYFESFSDIKSVKRAVKRVFDKINLKIQGVDSLEDGLELIVASITEAVVFDATNQKITVTTDFSSLAEPGDILVIYDSLYNNKSFTISAQGTAIVYPIPSEPVFEEASVTCSYAVYRPLRKIAVNDITLTDLTYVDGGGAPAVNTITSAGGELDFLEIGLEAGDLFKLDGATQATNNVMFEVSSTTATVISVRTLGKSGLVSDSTANDPAKITIYKPISDKYSYDLLTHKATVPQSVKEFKGLIYNTTELTARNYPFIKDSGNDSEKVFAPVGRLSSMLGDTVFVGAGDILRFNVKRDLTPPSAAYQDAIIDVPERYEGTLFWGVLALIASLPATYSEEISKNASNEYQISLGSLDRDEPSINPPTKNKLKFHF